MALLPCDVNPDWDDEEIEDDPMEGWEPARPFPSAYDLECAEEAHAGVVHGLTGVWVEWGKVIPGLCDPRDATPEPPAYLDPLSVLRMQRMVKDAAENGDRPWPYLGAA